MRIWRALLIAALASQPVLAQIGITRPDAPIDKKAIEGDIRSFRADSNAAMAAHDAYAFFQHYSPQYYILPGSLNAPVNINDYRDRIAEQMKDPTFVTYIRTPDTVTVAGSGKRAAEVGHWIGIWKKADGEMRLTGTYQAVWTPSDEGWVMRNESFVSLECTGSALCTEIY